MKLLLLLQIIPLVGSSALPAIFSDLSEVVLHSVVSRGTSSDDATLLTTVFLGHKAFSYMPQAPVLMVNKSALNVWRKVASSFQKHRLPRQLSCSFQLDGGGSTLTSQGTWLPSHTSADTGFNRNVEVLLCNLPPAFKSSKDATLIVSLTRDNVTMLAQFPVSMRKRLAKGGFGLSLSRKTSRWDPWESAEDGRGTFLACSVIRPLEPWRPDVPYPMLAEFVQHNILLGFSHQFLGAFLDRQGKEFARMAAVLKPFIDAGKVTLSPLSMRGVDDQSGALGLVFIDDYVRFVHLNLVLALSRGVADHLVIMQASEFLAPAPRFPTISALLQSLPLPLSQEGGTWPAYYKIPTFGVVDPRPRNRGEGGPHKHLQESFISQYYASSQPFGPLPAFNVAVVPTKACLLTAWHDAAVCGSSSGSKGRKADDFVKPSDALLLSPSLAQVYFYRQANFDVWQTRREHFPAALNNHTQSPALAKRTEQALLDSGVAAMVNGKLVMRGASPAAAAVAGTMDLPRGQNYLRQLGTWLECSAAKGCKVFGDLLK